MVLLLSLKLILLAFFILLNSLADVEVDRARAVIASVNQAFNGRIEMAGQLPVHNSPLGSLPEVEAKLRELGSLFEAIVPTAKVKEIRRAKAVRVDLPASALFRPASSLLRAGREDLILRLGESLRAAPPGAPNYELEVLFGVDARPDGTAGAGPAGSRSLELRRAAALAARLAAAGVPTAALSIGLRPAPADSLRLIVRLRREPGVENQPSGPWGAL